MSLSLREFHPFEAAGRRFLYLVPSAAVFALDDCSSAILDSLAAGPRGADDLTRELSPRFDSAEVGDTIAELQRVRALGESSAKPMPVPKIIPLKPVPLQTLVVNGPRSVGEGIEDRRRAIIEREHRRARHQIQEPPARGFERMELAQRDVGHCSLDGSKRM